MENTNQTQEAEKKLPPYPFDQSEIIVEFNARPGAKTPQWVSHRLRKPTLDELVTRERESDYEIHEIGKEFREVPGDNDPNVNLWNKIALAVKGYGNAQDWHELTEDDKKAFLPGHKVNAIRALYAGDAVVSDDVVVNFSGNSWKVILNIGPAAEPAYAITFTLREPTEKERKHFDNTESVRGEKKGAKNRQIVVRTNLRSYVELFDAVITGIEGGVVNDQELTASNREHFLAQIDANWKRLVVVRYWQAISGSLQD